MGKKVFGYDCKIYKRNKTKLYDIKLDNNEFEILKKVKIQLLLKKWKRKKNNEMSKELRFDKTKNK